MKNEEALKKGAGTIASLFIVGILIVILGYILKHA